MARPKGSKNKDDVNSLRKLLEIGFMNNRLAILSRINSLLQESTSLQDWKWIMQLKAALEPREIMVDAPQSQQIVLIRSNVIDIPKVEVKKELTEEDLSGTNGRVKTDITV